MDPQSGMSPEESSERGSGDFFDSECLRLTVDRTQCSPVCLQVPSIVILRILHPGIVQLVVVDIKLRFTVQLVDPH